MSARIKHNDDMSGDRAPCFAFDDCIRALLILSICVYGLTIVRCVAHDAISHSIKWVIHFIMGVI